MGLLVPQERLHGQVVEEARHKPLDGEQREGLLGYWFGSEREELGRTKAGSGLDRLDAEGFLEPETTVRVKERKSLGVRVGTPPRAELADEFVEKLCVGVVSVQPRSVLGLGLGLGLRLRSGLGLGAVPEQQGPITEEARR